MRAFVISLIVFAAALVHAQEPTFQCDVVAFQTKPFSVDIARVDVYIAVPYSLLTFVNIGERYIAEYSLTLNITGKSSDSLISKRRQDIKVSLTKSEWEKLEELKITRADASQFSFTLGQGGQYSAGITISARGGKRIYTRNKEFTVRRFPIDSVESSDLVVYRSRTGSRIVPLIGEEASELRPSEAGIFMELYNAPQSVPFYFLTRLAYSEMPREELGRNVSVIVGTGERRMPVFSSLEYVDLWKGSYILESFLLADSRDTLYTDPEDLRKRALSYSRRDLVVTAERGIPLASYDIDEAIEQLFYIAIGGAYDSLRRAETPVEKRRAIVAFWEGRKPDTRDDYNPPLEIFYRRVKYANDNFKGTQAGWRTDRGKIYIILGAPTYSQRYAYEVNQRPYEVWEYADLNQRYYFVDQFLVGDYRLNSPPPPPGTFRWERSSY